MASSHPTPPPHSSLLLWEFQNIPWHCVVVASLPHCPHSKSGTILGVPLGLSSLTPRDLPRVYHMEFCNCETGRPSAPILHLLEGLNLKCWGRDQWLLIHRNDTGLSVGTSSVSPSFQDKGPLPFYHPASLHYLCV